jgi:plasmid maintenance system antidote protein VapI
MTDLLRQTIADSGVPLLVLQRETGVKRASMTRFIRGETSLRLDKADALADYFGLKLVKGRKRR